MYDFFANPWMLSAVVAVSLPIIIEWLFRRRKRQVDLPTIRFLLRSKEQEKIRRQDRILLILRMLGLFLLVLAVSRPLLQHGLIGGARRRHIVVVLDGTASTNQQVGVTTAFGLAQKKAAGMVRELPDTAVVTAALLGDRAELIFEHEADLHTAAARIESLRAGSGAAPMSDALSWAADYLAAQKEGRPEVYVFSDFQKHTWVRGGEATSETSRRLGDLSSKYDAFLVDTGGDHKFNYMLTGLAPEEPLMSTGRAVRFRARLEAWGRPPEGSTATLTFLVDGVKKKALDARLGEGPVSLAFEHRFTKRGEYLVEAVLSGDEHRVDNRRFYLCTVPESARVLILDESADFDGSAAAGGAGTPANGGGKPADELSMASTYLARAIAPPGHPGMPRASRFSTRTIHPGQVDYENLGEYAAVVVTDLSTVSEATVAKLESYVADGGAVWFFLGERVNVYQYNKFLFKEGKGLLPAKLGAGAAASGKETPYIRFGESAHGAVTMLTGAGNKDGGFMRYMDVEPQEGAQTILKLSNGKPAVLARPFGRGKALLTTTTAGVEWTYLPATAEFPVLVQELMRHLVGDPDRQVNLEVGQRFEEAVFVSQQHLLLRCPSGRKERLKPRQREGRENAFYVSFDRTDRQGVYEFVDAASGVLPRTRFAVNQPAHAREGDLTRLNQSEFRGALNAGGWRWIGPEVAVEEFVARLHSVTEFAPIVLVLLVVVLALESFLAARFGRRRAITVGGEPGGEAGAEGEAGTAGGAETAPASDEGAQP